jgi:hypothetical protein
MITIAIISIAISAHLKPVNKIEAKRIETSSYKFIMQPAREKFNFPYIHTHNKLEAMEETICEMHFKAGSKH